ncbi:Sec-independent protein translocase protein TatB [Thiosulfativibrio zosterae]|uniref:Sec-independent protein translocase protein TatB n=1 Tax=Thiosulfativibrio zosterae TaxID=2675053 RepID=A0A6F8PK60_9GAMM|nr:Sec-independent protein translocase protein TatB [Thiosulfativibrio zosterae]BBP42466.1 Sec-independent protein translocase protein TatB [Thiosulfativibrio zosterae]
MFDIGLMEILLVLIIALLVIGPERMPEVARKIGQFVGKTKRFINTMKEDSELSNTVREIQASINLEEERKQLHEISQDLNNDFSSMTQEIDMNEFQRPTFGGPAPAPTTGSQFNKAPSQPLPPQAPATATPEPVIEKPVEQQTAPKVAVASTQPADQAPPTPAENNTVKS